MKIPFVGSFHLGVEARQAQRRGSSVEEGRQPAELAHAHQPPLVDHQRRPDAERDHVGKAVVLRAEGALGIGEARDAAVDAVQHHGHEDSHRGRLEAIRHGGDDGVEASEKRRRGEQIRQQIDAAALLSGTLLRLHENDA